MAGMAAIRGALGRNPLSHRLHLLAASFPHVRPREWLRNQVVAASHSPPFARDRAAPPLGRSQTPGGEMPRASIPFRHGSETPAGRALSGRSLALSAWWAQVYAARGEPRMRQYDGWISKAGARRGGGAPNVGNQSRCEKCSMDYKSSSRTPLLYSCQAKKLPWLQAVPYGAE